MSSSAATSVFCFDELGNVVVVERSELRTAPAVYGILVEEGRALLLPDGADDRWRLIGGRVLPALTPQASLARHFRRAAGFAPQVMQLLQVDTLYVVEQGQPWALGVLYYAVDRLERGFPAFDAANRPVWISLEKVSPATLRFGYAAVQTQGPPQEKP